MDNQEWKIRINRDRPTTDDELYIYRHVGNDIEIIESFSPETGVVMKRIPHRSAVEVRGLLMPAQDLAGIVRAFMKYAKDQGFKSADEGFDKGKLTATEAHLEDMRRLVFEDREIINVQEKQG